MVAVSLGKRTPTVDSMVHPTPSYRVDALFRDSEPTGWLCDWSLANQAKTGSREQGRVSNRDPIMQSINIAFPPSTVNGCASIDIGAFFLTSFARDRRV